ncbi:MAG: hypothetical protein DMF69_17545 [Acidobacteria bacterium]|nr:MAG: hypothetical protein DMF69_17545 [Acidobacteriota bacterium]
MVSGSNSCKRQDQQKKDLNLVHVGKGDLPPLAWLQMSDKLQFVVIQIKVPVDSIEPLSKSRQPEVYRTFRARPAGATALPNLY